MNDDTNDDPTFGKTCFICGGRIGAREGHEIDWVEDIIVFVHINCA